MKTKKEIKPKEKSSGDYEVLLKLGDKEHKISAPTIRLALETIKPAIVKSKGILIVKKGKLKTEMRLTLFQVKRLMINKVYKILLDKRLNNLLGIKI